MVVPPPLTNLQPSRLPRTNGFCPNGTACREIDAERRAVRHLSNNLDATGQIMAHCAASFSQHQTIR
jgi:hypothetical protein